MDINLKKNIVDKAKRYMYVIHLLTLLRFKRMVDSTDRQPSI